MFYRVVRPIIHTLCCILILAHPAISTPTDVHSAGGGAAAFAELKSGDLVFRLGRGMFSEMFRRVGGTDSPYSHAGIIYRENNKLYVIHTEASELTGIGGAKRDPLADFIGEDNACCYDFYRVAGISTEQRNAVTAISLAYVTDEVPFDLKFDLTDDAQLYCTELVYKAYQTAGIDLVDGPTTLHLPGNRTKDAVTAGQLALSPAIRLIETTNRSLK